MKVENIKSIKIDDSQYKFRLAGERDAQRMITDDVLITCDDVPVILYKKINKDLTKELQRACQTIPYQKSDRTSGLKSEARIFGYNPRNTIRKNFCSVVSLAREYPKEHEIIIRFSKELDSLYKEYFPDVYLHHKNIVQEKILKEWQIEGSVFTSGIINKNNRLAYHRDGGNFAGVFSNMIGFKKGIEGGHLVIPEFDIKLEIANNTVTLFDGQKYMHGVTSIHKLNKDSTRYTLVYYTLKGMWNCKPIGEEIATIRQKRTKMELKKITGE